MLTRLLHIASALACLVAFVCALLPSTSVHHFSREKRLQAAKEGKRILNPVTSSCIYLFHIPFAFGGLAVSLKHLCLQLGAKQKRGWRCRKAHVFLQRLQAVACKSISTPRWLAKLGWPSAVNLVDLFVFGPFLAVNWCLIFQWQWDYLQVGEAYTQYLEPQDWSPKPGPQEFWTWGGMEKLAIISGTVATMMMGWYLVLPMSRRSVFLEMLGMSWETAVKYHRWIGWHTTFTTILHIVLYTVVWVGNTCRSDLDPGCKMLRQNLLPWGCSDCDKEQLETYTFIMWGWGAFLLMLIMVCSSLERVRRRVYELFYILHMLWMPMLVMLQIHWPLAIYILGPGISMQCVDKTLALLAHFGAREAKLQRVCPEVVELVIPCTLAACCRPGQYIMLNVPAISHLQWHPYTVTWASAKEIAVHVKVLGSWTQALHDQVDQVELPHLESLGARAATQEAAARAASATRTIRVKVDGFYGHDAWKELRSKDVLFLWAGGVGITFVYSLAREACKRGGPGLKVFLRWVVRTEAEYAAFSRMLQQLPGVNLKIWVTQSTTSTLQLPLRTSELEAESTCCREDVADAGAVSWPQQIVGPMTSILSPSAHAVVSSVAIISGLGGLVMMRGRTASYSGQWWLYFAQIFYPFLCSLLGAQCSALLMCAPRVLLGKYRNHGESAAEASCSELLNEAFVSSGDGGEQSSSQLIQGRRPDVQAEFIEVSEELGAAGTALAVGVYVCGPLALTGSVQKECEKRVSDIHCWHAEVEPWEW